MTDNEIIKALEEILQLMCCEGDLQKASTISKALDLINRQKAEIERYREVVGKLAVAEDGTVTGLLNGKETKFIDKEVAETFKRFAVSEARKEFAERLKERYFDDNDIVNMLMEHIDNLLAKMESGND